MNNTDHTSTQLERIQARIQKAALNYNRAPGSITLVGASKQQGPELIASFAQCGLTAVGENYLQEALDKQKKLKQCVLDWHFIGQIQSNKTKLIAQHFKWIHTVDRLKIANRLAEQRQRPEPIRVLLQLNYDAEESKGGVTLEAATRLSAEVAALDNISLRGFMLIPRIRASFDEQRAVFAQARRLLEQTNQRYGLTMDTLSMGMSNDLEAAIAEGSTMVRIGADLFGSRKKPVE